MLIATLHEMFWYLVSSFIPLHLVVLSYGLFRFDELFSVIYRLHDLLVSLVLFFRKLDRLSVFLCQRRQRLLILLQVAVCMAKVQGALAGVIERCRRGVID